MADKLTPQEVAERINRSYVTTLKYIKRGFIKGTRRGGRWEVDPSEVDRFLNEGNYSTDIDNEEEIYHGEQ